MATDISDAGRGAAALTADEKRAALEQVLQAGRFVRADQLRSFLRFVGDMEICGRGDELSEYVIGVEALGRPADYSPVEDPVVRRRAVHLREKLEEVYRGELRDAPIRVDLPKGRYVPRFVRVEPAAAVPVAALPVAPAAEEAPRPFGAGHLALAFVAGALTVSAALLLWTRLPASEREHPFERGLSYEAETAENVFAGVAKPVMGCPNCSGAGRARSIGNGARNFVEFGSVRAARGGEHELVIHYLVDGERSFFVRVNDGVGTELRLSGSNWSVPAQASIRVPLRAGRNKVRLYNDHAWAPDLDRIVVRD